MASPFGPKKDQFFMQKALLQAQVAFKKNEVPIGAVIVNKNGIIISRGHNLVETRHTQVAHAEIIAIKKAGAKLKNWRLEGCWIFVTLEPCVMCMNLIRLSRMAGVIFGAQSPHFGFRLDNGVPLQVYKKDTVQIIQGVCADKAGSMLKQFFKEKRNSNEWAKERGPGSRQD